MGWDNMAEAHCPLGLLRKWGAVGGHIGIKPTQRKAKLTNWKKISDDIILAPDLALLEASLP